MSVRNRNNIPVKTVRIQWSDQKKPISYTDNVTVGIPKDPSTNIAYIRINVNEKAILSQELNHFQWLDDSCTNGVVTIKSPSVTIIIFYDAKERILNEFFDEMEQILKQRSTGESSDPSPHIENQIEIATNDLIRFIEGGSPSEAERAARYLAQSHSNIQFNLINHNDEENIAKATTPQAKASFNVLQLTLRIECHLRTNPIVQTIYVLSGTDLRSLKKKIKEDTGIKSEDQYWYAFDRYMIKDDYKFGSSDPVVPPLGRNAPSRQVQPPADPIRSGDTLIMYIAQLPSCK